MVKWRRLYLKVDWQNVLVCNNCHYEAGDRDGQDGFKEDGEKTPREVEVWIPTQAVMKMRMWLCATGFASNWFNECIPLPLIEHMPCVPSSRSHIHVVFVSSCSLEKLLALPRLTNVVISPLPSLCLALPLWRSYWFSFREEGGI